MRTLSQRWRQRGRFALAMLAMTGAHGCSRGFWREQADKDAYQAVTEHLTDPRWAVPRMDVTPDIRSRFYDPYNPDCAPLPPDDPAAHVYMHWVDGWEGYKGWHKFGDLMSVENPQWLANFGWSTDNIDPLTGELVGAVPALHDVKLTEAVELAQIHNRQYQTEIEDMYLAALAVTFQRFQFGVRYLDANGLEPSAGLAGNFVPHGPGDNVAASIGGGISQLLPAGTQWAMELANNTIWLFGGGNQTSSMSTLSFTLVQPLLFGAGRKVGLENLTQTERNLLYEARDLARFRQELFTTVVGGQFGFLGLLAQVQAIRNSRDNIARLEEQVERMLAESKRNELFANASLESLPPSLSHLSPISPTDPAIAVDDRQLGHKLIYRPHLKRLYWRDFVPITDATVEILRNLDPDPGFQLAIGEIINSLRTEVATLDVLQLQSQLTNQMNALRAQERALQDDLDSYKILLGLPPDMEFTIDDTLLKPFQIIDPALRSLEERGKDFVDVSARLDGENPDANDLRSVLSHLERIVEEVTLTGLQLVEADLLQIEVALPQRLELLTTEEDRRQLRMDVDRASSLFVQAQEKAREIRRQLQSLKTILETDHPNLESRQVVYRGIGELREDLVQLAQNLTVVQVSLRVEFIETQPFEMSMQEAISLGLENRVDLMNARALVMDARREVEIAANRLQATLDLVARADVNTPPGTRPFDFRGDESRLRVGVAFTAPLDQIDERNIYRETQLRYQRERRAYMQAEDAVKQEVRQAWRQLFVLRQNLETSRRAVRLAALQYDSAVNESQDPSARSSSGGMSGGGGGRGGSGVQGTNLLNALNAILTAQNQLVSNFVNYERNRLNIYRDMGIMVIGEDGLWDDPFYRSMMNDSNVDPNRRRLDADSAALPDLDLGRSGLGRGSAEFELVAESVGEQPFAEPPQGPRHGDGQTRTVSLEPFRSGLSR